MSAAWTAAAVAAATGGTTAGDWVAAGVSIDTRTLAPGDLFVALTGPHRDAHAFVGAALDHGAAGAIVSRVPEGITDRTALVLVDDTQVALERLGCAGRARSRARVAGITGSVGKTGSKEALRHVLARQAPTHASAASHNNQWGVPLSLARLPEGATYGVFEIGMNHAGEIAPLAAITRPTVALLTNVGTAHIENLGSQDAIAAEKGALFEALAESGVAVANADDPRVVAQLARTKARPLLFGLDARADVRAEAIETLGARGCGFVLVTPQGRARARVAGIGQVPVINALGAAAAALAAGAALEDAVAGLAAYRPPAGRLEPVALPGDGVLLNDTYNANPQSMEVALRSLAAHKGTRRGIAVIGDMGELGATATAAHRNAGRLAAQLGLDFVFALGAHAGEVVAGAIEGGLAQGRACEARDHDDLATRVREALRDGDWVLVKGSRSMQMERIVAALGGETEPVH